MSQHRRRPMRHYNDTEREIATLTRRIIRRKRRGLDWTNAVLRSRLAYLLSDEEVAGKEHTLLVLSANHVRNGW